MRTLFIGIYFFLSFATLGLAQKNVEFSKESFPTKKDGLKEAIKNIESGDGLYEQRLYAEACGLYLKANAFNPDNAVLNYKIGLCFLNDFLSDTARYFLEKAYALYPEVSTTIIYELANVNHLTLHLDRAIELFKKYSSSPDIAGTPEEKEKILRRIKECENAKELIKNPLDVLIQNLGSNINSPYEDYAPVISADESVLMFTSRRPHPETNPDPEFPYDDIYISTNVNGVWSKPVNPGKPLNTEKHDATIGVSNDGQILLLYKDINAGDIYRCKLEGKNWQKPLSYPDVINSKFHEPAASLSFNNRALYFVSERKGGLGGKDIFVSKINKDGEWGDAENLGNIINTPYDEDAVFIHPDGKTIYFSSNGHKTLGGFDIFKSVFSNGSWSKPENIGYPINTPGDDAMLVISASGMHGYYASRRAGGFGKGDIYMVDFFPPKPKDTTAVALKDTVKEQPQAITADLTLFKGTILDVNKVPVKAVIEVFDNQTNEIVASVETNSETGKFLVSLPSGKNYGVNVKAEDYLFHSENFDIEEGSGFHDVSLNIVLQKVEAGAKITLNNIFFASGKTDLTKESIAEIERIIEMMNKYKTMKIEISGHTDNVGSAAFNQKLSEDRAMSVCKAICEKGIDKTRVAHIGLGFEKPVAPNDTEENRRKNRRTEFKIISK